jgi:putative cardiolipin synthase
MTTAKSLNLQISRLAIVSCLLWFSPAAQADKMLILDNPVEAAQARIDLLQQARKSIKAQYFIVGSDPLTYSGLALAREAARRGCDVRIIVDAGSNSVPSSVSAYLMTQGVQIKLYHPFSLLHLSWLTRRMHDKGLSIDGKKMVRGGRNVQDSYFGRATTNFIDRDAYLEGQVVKDSDAYFDKLWDSNEVRWVNTRHVSARRLEEGRTIIEAALADTATSKKWKLRTGRDWGRGLRDLGTISFLYDPVGRKDKDPGIAENLRDLMGKAQKSILIESPYMVPTPEFLREIRSAQDRGVESIEIVTNSAASTDGLLAQAGYAASRKKLCRMGVTIWEFKGPDTLHAKSAVFDDRHAVVGSFNVDPRSQRLNTETAVAIEDRNMAAALKRSIDAHKQLSWRLGPDGRPAEAAADYPGISLKKRIKICLFRMTLPLIWNQL